MCSAGRKTAWRRRKKNEFFYLTLGKPRNASKQEKMVEKKRGENSHSILETWKIRLFYGILTAIKENPFGKEDADNSTRDSRDRVAKMPHKSDPKATFYWRIKVHFVLPPSLTIGGHFPPPPSVFVYKRYGICDRGEITRRYFTRKW